MKLLAVSFAFPPIVAPRAIQVARLLRHLDAEVALVCAMDESELQDASIEIGAESALAICRRVPFERSRFRQRADAVAFHLGVPLWNRRPDRFRRWIRPAVSAAEEIVRSGFRPDALVTFGKPMTDHLIGRRLVEQLKVPWIAHFSDPWTNDPFARGDRLEHWVNRRQESGVMEAADSLLFTSSESQAHMLRDAPDAWHLKAGVLPHSFGVTQPPVIQAAPAPDDPIVVRHLGTLYGRRSIQPVVNALLRLVSADPSRLAGVRFEFVGLSNSDSFASESLARLPPGLVTARPRVSYRESLSLMAQSDGLLLLDGTYDGPGIFFPAKLADYVGSGQPLFGVATAGPAAGVIERMGGPVASILDPEDIARKLADFTDLLRKRRRGGTQAWGDGVERARYAAPNVARGFREHLSGLVGR